MSISNCDPVIALYLITRDCTRPACCICVCAINYVIINEFPFQDSLQPMAGLLFLLDCSDFEQVYSAVVC